MEASNTGIIRVPIADPAGKKEGVLCFGLPRECVKSKPAFYGRDTFTTSLAAVQPIAPQRSLSAGDSLDGVLRDLEVARGHLSNTREDVRQADANVRSAQGKFGQVDGPLGQAEGDDGARDVSGHGEQLDFILSGARDHMRDVRQGANRAGTDGSMAHEYLGTASEQLVALTEQMRLEPQRYGAVLPLLEQAHGSLQTAFDVAGHLNETVGEGKSHLTAGEDALLHSDEHVHGIRSDAPGVDVSPSALQLRAAVSVVSRELDGTAGMMSKAAAHVGNSDQSAASAEELLRTARAALVSR